MQLQLLSKSFVVQSSPTPPVYTDHFLFSENLRAQYECPEQASGIGLLITRKGNCNYYVNGIKNQVSGNKVLFVNRGSQLAIRIAEKGAAPALLFFHSRFPDLIQHSMNNGNEELPDDPTDTLPYDFSYLERLHDNQALHATVSSLIPLGDSCSSFAALNADIIIRNLFENLLRENHDSYKLSQNLNAAKASTRLEIFKRVSLAREWMDGNYQTNITLEDMAGISTMNSQHFLRMFKQVYNITPHQYLVELKLNKAKDLLESTKLPVADICYNIGFESIFSFSILFKRRFGVAPSHFRKA